MNLALDLDVEDIVPAVNLVSRLSSQLEAIKNEEGPAADALKVAISAAIAIIEEAVADAYREIATGDVQQSGLTSQIIDQELDEIVGEGGSESGSQSGGSG